MSVFFLFEVYRAKVLMAVQNAQHDEFFFGLPEKQLCVSDM
jgi:hypothetical protein